MIHTIGDTLRISAWGVNKFDNPAKFKGRLILIILFAIWIGMMLFSVPYGNGLYSSYRMILSTAIVCLVLLILFVCKIIINKQIDWGLILLLIPCIALLRTGFHMLETAKELVALG